MHEAHEASCQIAMMCWKSTMGKDTGRLHFHVVLQVEMPKETLQMARMLRCVLIWVAATRWQTSRPDSCQAFSVLFALVGGQGTMTQMPPKSASLVVTSGAARTVLQMYGVKTSHAVCDANVLASRSW